MARAVIPIIALTYGEAFDLDALDVFSEHGVNGEDEFTFTTRVSVTDPASRGAVREALRSRLPADQAERLVALLDGNEWDVSFLVDCF